MFVPEPRVVTPPGRSPVWGLPCDLTKLPDIREISLDLPPVDTMTLCLHVWEKGNVGVSDLQKKLATTFQQALLDLIMEMYLLPEPIAKVSPPGGPEGATPPGGPEGAAPGPHDPSSSLPGQAQRHEENGELLAEDGQERRGDLSGEEGQEKGAAERSLSWHHIEWVRRRDEEAQKKLKMAARGHLGVLVDVYHTSIPQCLSHAHQLSSPSAAMFFYDLVSCRSAYSFMTEAVLNIKETCPDAEVQGFRLSSQQKYFHFYSEKEVRDSKAATYPGYQMGDTDYVIVCRNPGQWEESCDPTGTDARSGQVWVDSATKQPLQLYLPLDSKKVLKGQETPLQLVAIKRNIFLPRQRLILVTMECAMVSEWVGHFTPI